MQSIPTRRQFGVLASAAALSAAASASGASASAADPAGPELNWPSFRGPRGDGTSPNVGLPTSWSEKDNVVWKTEIHDKGWSSPVVWGNQVWMATAAADGKKMYAVCVDRESGKIVHDKLLFEVENPRFCHPTNSYASCTPAIEDGRVYLHFGSYGTVCLDTSTGAKIWERRDFVCDDYRGPASSPVVYDKLLLVHFDGFDQQFVVGIDKDSGKTVWRTDRKLTYSTDNGDVKKAYATPMIVEVDGQVQMISSAAQATQAFDPLTGKLLWEFNHGGMNSAIRPLWGEGLLFVTTGDGPTKLVAIKPQGAAGDVAKPAQAWSDNKGAPKRPSPVLKNGLLFIVTDDGIASARKAADGAVVWRQRFAGQYWSSPVCVDGRLFFFNQEGKCTIVAAKDEFQLLGENQLDKGCNASPAVSGKALFVRTFTHLYRIEQK